jgi:hypothetical protein
MDTWLSFAYPSPSMNDVGTSPQERDSRDEPHISGLVALAPVLNGTLGLSTTTAPVWRFDSDVDAAVVAAHQGWRLAVEADAASHNDRERNFDARVLSASVELLRFGHEQRAVLPNDPDRLSQFAELVLVQLRGMLPTQAEERFRGLSLHLSALPAALRAAPVLPSSAELLARACDVIDGLPELLRAVSDAGHAARDVPSSLRAELERAVDHAGAACDEQRRRLSEMSPVAVAPVGAALFDEVLRLRGLDLDHHEVFDICRMLAEELRVEQSRLRAKRSKAIAVAPGSEHCPQHRSEALVWMRELVGRSRSFFAEHGGVPLVHGEPDNPIERLQVDALPACFAPHGRRAWYVPAQRYAPRQDALLLLRESLGPQEAALADLSVFELEALQATMGFPGRHTAEVWWQRLTTIARRGALVPRRTIAGTWGADLMEGWGLFAAELTREANFRPSTMAKLAAVDQAHRAALLGLVDVALGTGRMDPQQAAEFLVRRGAMRLPVARALVRGVMAVPTSGVSAIIGKVRIDQLRREAYKRWRGTFNLRRFSTLLLAHGPVPLAYLFERLEEPAQYLNNVPTSPM